MNKFLITLGGSEQGWSRHNEAGIFRSYQLEALRLIDSVKNFDLNPLIISNEFLNNLPYRTAKKDVMDKVSFGYSYKAICLWEHLKNIEYGDVLILIDSNHIFINDPDPIINLALENGCFVWSHDVSPDQQYVFKNKYWTKKATFIKMGCDEFKYWETPQIHANVIAICKNLKTVRMIREFISYSLDPEVMFGLGEYENDLNFQKQRYDQSILTNLIIKFNFPIINRYENIKINDLIIEGPPIQIDSSLGNHNRRTLDKDYFE